MRFLSVRPRTVSGSSMGGVGCFFTGVPGLANVVNTAAIVKSDGFLSISGADLDLILNVNLKGAFNVCQSVLPVFERAGKGTIVNIASVAAQRGGGLVGGAHYAASKGGMVAMTKSIARAYAAQCPDCGPPLDSGVLAM